MNQDLDDELLTLPDAVAHAFELWQTGLAELKRMEALKYLTKKAENPEMNSTELKAWVQSDEGVYKFRLEIIKAEAEHMRLLEKHLSNKKRAGFRTAF